MTEKNREKRRSASRIRLSIIATVAVTIASARAGSGSTLGTASSTEFSFSPPKVFLQIRAGSTVGLSADVNVAGAGGGPLTYTASCQSEGGWLKLGNVLSGLTVSLANIISGTAPGSLRVIAVVDNLPVGTYNGTIVV